MLDESDVLEQAPFPPGDVKEIGFQIKSLDRMFRKHMENTIREHGFEGMSAINVWIIDYLAQNEEKNIFQKDIERQFKTGKSSIAGTLKVMEEKGVIVRRSVEGDARLKRVCLTDKGRQYAFDMNKGREYMEQKVSAGIPKEDLNHFFSIIQKMQENLTE